MDKYRKISAAAIIRNIKAVLKLLNTIEFNNMKIKMRAHRIISCELLKDLERDNSVDTYYNNLYYFDRSLNYSNSNFDIDFYPTLGFEMPLNVTKEDGIRLSEFMTHDRISYSQTLFNIIKQYNCQTFDEFCHLFLKDKEAASQIINELNNDLYCGINYNELSIRYDGTIVGCENMIFNSMEKMSQIEKSWQIHQLCPNIYNSDSKDIDNLLKMFAYNRTAWSFIIEHMMIQIQTMAQAQEIKDIYNNDEFLIFKYAFLGLTLPWCYYSNLMTSGSIYLQGKDFFNFFYNGYIELVEQQYDRMLKQ